MSKQTIVVGFGESSSSTAVFELDGQSHLDDEGNERTYLYEGEEGILRLHHPDTYVVTAVIPIRGTVVALGRVTRTVTQELYFTSDASLTLTYTPAGPVGISWDGRAGAGLAVAGRSVAVSSGWPCKGTARYAAQFMLYRFVPPSSNLAEDESLEINVEAYLEAV